MYCRYNEQTQIDICKKQGILINIQLNLTHRKNLTTTELFELQNKYKPDEKTGAYIIYRQIYNRHFSWTMIDENNLNEYNYGFKLVKQLYKPCF